MERDKLLAQFEKEFAQMRLELGFRATLEEIDGIFFIRDFILSAKFVSRQLSRMVCSRIVDFFNMWIGALHGYLMPNPGSMIMMAESQVFSDKEKQEFIVMINKMKALISTNLVIGMNKDKEMESAFIDDSVALWRELRPRLIELSSKVNDYWKKEAAKA